MDNTLFEQLLEKYGLDKLSHVLELHLTANRCERIAALLDNRLNAVHIAIEAPSDPHNAAAIVRSAEALGAMGVHVIAAEGRVLQAKRTTKGSFNWIDCYHHSAFTNFNQVIKKQQRVLVGATLDATASLADMPIDKPLCILLGNEQRGLSLEAQAACDSLFKVPMYGMSESFNLSVAAAISLYDISQRIRQQKKSNGDLSAEQKEQLKVYYYAQSVDKRLLQALL